MNENNGGIQFVLGLCLGLVGGAVVTLLLTPQRGSETRRQLQESTFREANTFVTRIIDILEDEARRAVQRIGDELLEATRKFMEEQQAQLRARLQEDGAQKRAETVEA